MGVYALPSNAEDFTSAAARAGAEALPQRLTAGAVVLVDLRQERDPASVVSALRQRASGQRVFCVGVVDEAQLGADLAAGLDDFVLGPVRGAELAGRVQRVQMAGCVPRSSPGGVLHAAEERFALFTDNGPAISFMKDPQGRYVFVSAPFERQLGLARQAVLGRTDAELFEPEHALRIQQNDSLALCATGPVGVVETLTRADGEPRQYLINKFAVRCPSGAAMVGGVGVDITERRRAEQALTASDESLRAIIASLPDAVLVHSFGPVIYANPAAARLFGCEVPREVLGQPVYGLFDPDDVEAAVAVLSEGPAGTVRGLRELRLKVGARAVVEVSSVCTSYEGAPSVVVVLRDVTERRRLQERLGHAERMASLGTLAAGVAHEINNPLAYIVSNLNFLAAEVGSLSQGLSVDHRQDLQDALEQAQDGARRVTTIVRDLKLLSRRETARQPVDVARVLESALSIAGGKLKQKARLVRELDPVPAVFAEEVRLGQVLVNLLVNAIDALPADAPQKHEVRVGLHARDGRVVVEVADTGSGIPPEVRAHIFDPFFTTKPVGEGTGLGLAICHGIVDELGGRLWFDTEVGRGTTFYVELPAAEGTPQQPSPARFA